MIWTSDNIMNPLRFAPPLERPSRSPIRNQFFTQHELHPLLRDLSPTSTLEALESTEATIAGSSSHKHALLQSIAEIPISDRTWGIKAALAGKKVRAWLEEVSAWRWPSETTWEGYLPPDEPLDETTRSPLKDALDHENYTNYGHEAAFYGSLPGSLLRQYERRVEEIRDDLDTLDIDDIKNFIRSMLAQSRSRQPSIAGLQDLSWTTGALSQLDDFQAIITVTVVQSLPNLTRLDELLDVWSTRMYVMRQIPAFTKALVQARSTMMSAWAILEVSWSNDDSSYHNALLSRKEVEECIARTGRLLDSMLDGLEGQQDTIPEEWIDELEHLEGQLSSFSIEMEEKLMQLQMHDEETIVAGESDVSEALPPSKASNATRHGRNIEEPRLAEEPHVSQVENPESDLVEVNPSYSASDTKGMSNRNATRSQKPSPLTLHRPTSSIDSNLSSSFSSGYSAPGSATSGSFSNMSSPEIQSASKAEYFGAPVEVITPALNKDPTFGADMLSRHSSQRTERGVRRSLDEVPQKTDSPASRSRASTFVPRTTILEHNMQSDSEADDLGFLQGRSASVKSFEHVARREIKNVMVRRSGSYSLLPLKPTDLSMSLQAPGHGDLSHTQSTTHDEISTRSITNPVAHEQHTSPKDDRAGLAEKLKPIKQPATPATTRPHSQLEDYEDFAPSTSPVKVQKTRRPTTSTQAPPPLHDSPANISKAARDSGDQLEARISSILEDLPGAIRLTSESRAPRRLSDLRHTSNPSPKLTRTQTVLSPSISKAPKSDQPQQASHDSSSSDIKLYHLHQAGKEQPIKLFVRLVGENGERVMVRIGGGWADLGEYLKEYAGHHRSKRAASDAYGSGFSVQNLPGSEANSPAPSTPGSDLRSGAKSRQSSYYVAKPGSSGIQNMGSMPSSTTQSFHAHNGEATSRPSSSHSRPSSSSNSRPTSRHSNTEAESSPMGGAGPRSKKIEVSPSKQAWVDGMVEQARKIHVDYTTEIGDLGKAGGTRRVFLKAKTTK